MSHWQLNSTQLNHGIWTVVSLRPTGPILLLIEVGTRQFATSWCDGVTVR